MRSCRHILLLALVPAAMALFPRTIGAEVHQDPVRGFQIVIPKDWKSIPIANTEDWIVAKYVCDREYVAKKEYYPHTPDLKVIVFPERRKERANVEVDLKPEEEGGVTSIKILDNPYRDYKDYLSKNSYGGYHIADERETTINGVPTTCIEVKFEKLTVPRRGIVWVFHGEDADWAVQFEVLEDYWDKLRPEFLRSLRSFRLIPRTEEASVEGGLNPLEITISGMNKSTPKERAAYRTKRFEKELEIARDRLPKEWIIKRSKNYVALSHADAKYTQRMLDQAEAVRAWLDKNMDWVGDGIPGSGIIRICENYEEASAFFDRSSDAWGTSIEINTYKDVDSGRRSFASQFFNRGVLSLWFLDKNSELSFRMPSWLRFGLEQVIMTSDIRGKRIVGFRPDEWESQGLRDVSRRLTPRDFFGGDHDDLGGSDTAPQAGAFVRFLITNPKARSTLEDYLKNLSAIVEEESEKRRSESDKREEAKTEEEEEARYRESRQRGNETRKMAFERTFGSWSDQDWALLERSYSSTLD